VAIDLTQRNEGWLAAQAGDLQAALRLGRELICSFDFVECSEGVRLLRMAYDGGQREAGWQLAFLPGHLEQSMSGLSQAERVELVEEEALAGGVSAALNLMYSFASDLPPDRVRKVLELNAAYSTELAEMLKNILDAENQ